MLLNEMSKPLKVPPRCAFHEETYLIHTEVLVALILCEPHIVQIQEESMNNNNPYIEQGLIGLIVC